MGIDSEIERPGMLGNAKPGSVGSGGKPMPGNPGIGIAREIESPGILGNAKLGNVGSGGNPKPGKPGITIANAHAVTSGTLEH